MNKLVSLPLLLLGLLVLLLGGTTIALAQTTPADAAHMQATTARFRDYTTAFMSFADTMKGADRDNANAFGAIATISAVRYEFLAEELHLAASLADPADKDLMQKIMSRRLNEELNYHEAIVKELTANIGRTRKPALATLANKLKLDLLKSQDTLQRLARNLQVQALPQDAGKSITNTTQKAKAGSE